MEKIKIIFLGTPDFAVPTLKALAGDDSIDVQMVVTQPDKPVGRKGELTPPPIKETASELGLNVFQPDDVNQSDVLDVAENIRPDFVVVVAYGQILGSRWLKIANKDILNLHASLLPKYRGASPIQSAVLSGDEIGGVSIMGVRKKMDTGPVYAQEEFDISSKTSPEVFDESSEKGAGLMLKVLTDFDQHKPVEQDDSMATYCKKIERSDGEVSIGETDSEEIMRKYRAFYGWPGIYTIWKGKRLKLIDIENCDGTIKINRIQPEGKKEMSMDDFLRGNPDFVGGTGD